MYWSKELQFPSWLPLRSLAFRRCSRGNRFRRPTTQRRRRYLRSTACCCFAVPSRPPFFLEQQVQPRENGHCNHRMLGDRSVEFFPSRTIWSGRSRSESRDDIRQTRNESLRRQARNRLIRDLGLGHSRDRSRNRRCSRLAAIAVLDADRIDARFRARVPGLGAGVFLRLTSRSPAHVAYALGERESHARIGIVPLVYAHASALSWAVSKDRDSACARRTISLASPTVCLIPPISIKRGKCPKSLVTVTLRRPCA